MARSNHTKEDDNNNNDNHGDDDDSDIILWQDLEERELVEIPISNESTPLRLRQYVSHDDRWGIHSSVWEGGLALLAYLSETHNQRDALIIDLGAGTGIVGLGCALLGYTNKILLTDLDEALPLLKDNVQRNALRDSEVIVTPLVWGEPLSSLVRDSIVQAEQVLVLGADIVYRQNIMDPLIRTLVDLLEYPNVTCWLSTHTIRTHLPEFFQKCEQAPYSLQVDVVASVQLPDDKVEAVQTSTITTTTTTTTMLDTPFHHQQIPKETSVVAISEIRRKSH
jgi:predicted nicotinamide N-methyase